MLDSSFTQYRCLIQSANDWQDPYPTPCTPGIKIDQGPPFNCWLTLEPTHCFNSVSHSNKVYFSLILSCVGKFFSNPQSDHNTPNPDCSMK